MAMLFTLTQARALPPLDSIAKYPDAAIVEAGELASDALEHACGVSFAPASFTEALTGNGRPYVSLAVARPLALTAATLGGADVLAGVTLMPDGRLHRAAGWTAPALSASPLNLAVSGTAGYATTPPRVARAALLLAKRYLVYSAIPDRATSFTGDDGQTERYITAGMRELIFDVPEANAVVMDYGIRKGRMIA